MALLDQSSTQDVPVPHEPGCTFTFRRLTWTEMEEAREKRRTAQLQRLQDMGGDLVKAIFSTGGAADADSDEDRPGFRKGRKPRKRDADQDAETVETVGQYDKAELLRIGLVTWSGPGYDRPCNEQTQKSLDPATAEWAADTVFELNRKRTAAELKNASSGSTSH